MKFPNYSLILSILVCCASCCKDKEAFDLLPEQLEWLPYENGQTLQFVNAENDSIKNIEIAIEEHRSDGSCATIYESEPGTIRKFSLPGFYNNANDFGFISLGAYIDDDVRVYYLSSSTDRIRIDLVNLIEYTIEYTIDGSEPFEINTIERTVYNIKYADVIKLKERDSSNSNQIFIAKGTGIIEYTFQDQTWYLVP